MKLKFFALALINFLVTFLTTSAFAEPFGPGCPWYDMHVAHPGNIEWCEEKLCLWFVTPFNALTNFAYVAVGIYLWFKLRNSPSRLMRSFGFIPVVVGICSLAWHSTLNVYTQLFDYFGMYCYLFLLIMFNLARLKKWPERPRTFRRFWIWVSLMTAITWASLQISNKFPIQLYIPFLIIVIMVTELVQKAPSRKFFWITFTCILVAGIFSGLDAARILCFPENHFFQGHGIWHLLSALGLYFAYRHYEQFEKEIL